MADRTTPKIYERRPSAGRDAFPIANTVTLAPGTLVGLAAGYANHWDNGAATVFVGIAIAGDNIATAATSDQSTWLGDTSLTPDPEVHVDTSGTTLMHLASVAGTPTQAKVGDLIFATSSDPEDITLTSTTSHPIGWMVRFRSATDVDVRLFTASEALAQLTA